MNLKSIFEAKYSGLNLQEAYFVVLLLDGGDRGGSMGGPFRSRDEGVEWITTLEKEVQEMDPEGRNLLQYSITMFVDKVVSPDRVRDKVLQYVEN